MSKLLRQTESSGGGDFKQLSEGTHIGTLYQAIDLGLQKNSFMGEDNPPAYKLWLSFEFPHELTDDGRPLIQGLEVKLSLHEKAKLTQIVRALTGGTSEALKEGISISELLGKSASIGVGRTASGRAKLTTFQALPKGTSAPAVSNELVEFNLEEPSSAILESLPQFLQDKIAARLDNEVVSAASGTSVDF